MVVRVAQNARESGAARVVIACDDERIRDAAHVHGVEAVLTRTDHPTGTDRLAEAAQLLALPDDEIVVNVQGDEPLLAPRADRRCRDAARLPRRRGDRDRVPSDRRRRRGVQSERRQGRARRARQRAVLQPRDDSLGTRRVRRPPARTALLPQGLPIYRHYGLYAYRVAFLRRYPTLAPAPIERFEALEQLRALWHGERIVVQIAAGTPAPGVDTPEDLARVRALHVGGI